jgi:outer membrane receptor protein involved in Fe transport
MNKLLLAVFFGCLCTVTYAQTTVQTLTVKGTVIDSAINKPLGYVTVALVDPATKASVRGALSKDDGTFQLKAPEGKTYQLTFVFVGYKTKTIMLKTKIGAIAIGNVLLSPSSNTLKDVSVTAVKPLVKQEIDRISYDVQADPETKTQNVLDMLRKVPLITVDASDNIQLKGESNYKILINGKPSSLVAHNPSDVFKSMPASSIQRIEVITTPPAKYDAEGLAGIINIITNKKVDQGYNGSINMRYNTLYGPGGGMSLNLKEGKFGLSMYTGGSDQKKRYSNSESGLETFGADATNLAQSNSNTNWGHFLYNSEELSYEIDSLNLVTASIDINHGQFNSESNQFSQEFDATNTLIQNYRIKNTGNNGWNGFDLGINYQLGFKRSKDQLLTLSYKYSKQPNANDNNELIFDRFNYGLPSFTQQNDARLIEQTAQVDYVHPLKKLNIEGGLKGIFRSATSDFSNSDLDTLNNNYVLDPSTINNFNYQQDIYSIYNTYQLNLTSWAVKAGARLETTTVNADFLSGANPVHQDYSNFIPSVSLQRKFKDGTSINFGFTNRIQRPSINELNPFVDESNPRFISTGNPALTPVVNHTFELNYSHFSKGSVNLGLSYSFANNAIQSVTKLVDTVTYTMNENVGSDKNLGFNASVNYPITKKLNLNLNARVSYVTLRGYFNGELYNNNGFQGYTFAYAGYKFSDTWRAGINGGFYSANVLLQGKSSSSIFSSVSTSKDLLNKKLSVYVAASNPFTKYRTYNSYTRDVNFYQSSESQNPYRSINFGVSYRFGKLKAEIKKNEHGIENDDTKGSSKNTGNSGN